MSKLYFAAVSLAVFITGPVMAQSHSTISYSANATEAAQRSLVQPVRPGDSTRGYRPDDKQVHAGVLLLRQHAYEQAYAKFYAAAQDGNGRAMRELAWMHAEARGVPADPAKALGWFQEAALAGDEASMLVFGTALARGLSIDRRPETARYWLEQARRSKDSRIVAAATKELHRL